MVFGYRNPRHPLRQLRDEMDRLWTGFIDSAADGFGTMASQRRPSLNAWERDNALVVELETPGVKQEQIDVSVSGDELSIRIERPDATGEGAVYHRRERPVGTFNRILRLPVAIDAERVEAEVRNGVLTITLPKAESAKPRKINVTAS